MLCGSSATSEADSVKSRKRVMHFEVSILVENHQPRAYPFSQLVQFSSVSVKMLLLHVFLFYNFLVILMLTWYQTEYIVNTYGTNIRRCKEPFPLS